MADKERDPGKVIFTQHNQVALLTLSRVNSLNAMTWEMYEQLEGYLDELKSNEGIRVLVINGDGEKAFAAGTDISQFQNFTGEQGVNYERDIDRIMTKLENFPKPTIAAIQGFAIGGGMMTATVCDLRYSTAKAKFGAPIAKTLGNCLSRDNIQRLATALGDMPTKQLLYTAKLINAEKADSLGFLTDILEEENFNEQVLEIAKKISENAPLTVEATKKAFQHINSKDTGDTAEFEQVISQVYGSDDFAEGVTSYLEKRPPVWQGK